MQFQDLILCLLIYLYKEEKKHLTTVIHNKETARPSRKNRPFDNVDQEKMVEAMSRLGLPKKILDVLASFYVNPQYRVEDREGKSTYRTQRAGMRQGCPLSPYLFTIVMSVV